MLCSPTIPAHLVATQVLNLSTVFLSPCLITVTVCPTSGAQAGLGRQSSAAIAKLNSAAEKDVSEEGSQAAECS